MCPSSRSSSPGSPAWPWRVRRAAGLTDLLLVGDTNVQNRDRPAEAFAGVRATLRAAGLVFGHLEGPFAAAAGDGSGPDIPHKVGWTHSAPAMVEGFVDAGFAGVSCASNVSFGRRAIEGTLATLHSAGIGCCGIGRDRREARRPLEIRRDGVRFGFLSYTSVFWPVGHAATEKAPGVATIRATTAYQPHPRVLEMPGAPARTVTQVDPAELAEFVADVRRLRRRVDMLVVSCHWGVSSSSEVQDYQRVVGRAAIEAGADVVMGHHPHVLQPIEVWRGRPIFYSLGNFAFDWFKMRGNRLDGLLVRCLMRGRRLESVSFVPVRRDRRNNVALLDPARAEGQRIVEGLRALGGDAADQLELRGREVALRGVGPRRTRGLPSARSSASDSRAP